MSSDIQSLVNLYQPEIESFAGEGFSVMDFVPANPRRMMLRSMTGEIWALYIVEDRLIIDDYVPEAAEADLALGADPAESEIRFDDNTGRLLTDE